MPQTNRAPRESAPKKTPISSAPISAAAVGLPDVQPLTNAHYGEVLAFLAAHSVDTIFMSGLVRDNGIVSDLNRGTFYGCRDSAGQLEGVALVGHATLVEARTDAALAAFARLARDAEAHVICGERSSGYVFS